MAKKKRNPKQRTISIQKAIMRTLILVAAYLMEEQDWNDDQLCEFYDAISRWSEAVNTHLIPIQKVVEIINEKTGATIRW